MEKTTSRTYREKVKQYGSLSYADRAGKFGISLLNEIKMIRHKMRIEQARAIVHKTPEYSFR